MTGKRYFYYLYRVNYHVKMKRDLILAMNKTLKTLLWILIGLLATSLLGGWLMFGLS